MKMPNCTALVLVCEWAAFGLARGEGCGERNERQHDHHDRYAGGAAEISAHRGGDDRREPAADRRRYLEAEGSAAVADARAEQFGEVGGFGPEHHAVAE